MMVSCARSCLLLTSSRSIHCSQIGVGDAVCSNLKKDLCFFGFLRLSDKLSLDRTKLMFDTSCVTYASHLE